MGTQMKPVKVDEYGVKQYALWARLLLAFTTLYTYIYLMAYPLYIVEHVAGNIKSYDDAFWVLQMAASTIGFGDFYPVTPKGRWIVAFSFYIGVGLAAYIGASIAGAFTGFTETEVQNRELRRQNAEILNKLIKLEERL